MSPVVRTIYQESEFGVDTELSAVGTSLENPYVYDSAAREFMSMAQEGLVEIRSEQTSHEVSPPLVERLTFARLR
jgi:hypothetical protein